ncbi:MAG: aminotransferase class I/II-fold pyridoxal phosphate-dependent enzyme [Planctomycetota bacterium]
MSQLANAAGAINLSQGFPNFEGPASMIDAVYDALRSGENQYARSQGHPVLTAAVAERVERRYGLRYCPETEVAAFHGATEAIAAFMLGMLDPGDEVILFEPFYDSYPACCALAQATPRFATLRYPDFRVDRASLEATITDRTRLLVLNSPHNPTGRVFTTEELEIVASVCREHDLTVLSDEVYEEIWFDEANHVSIATLPGMRERTITVSSCGKTFSFTGWKVGWATGPEPLIGAAQAAHQFLTFCGATPLQAAVGRSLREIPESYYVNLRDAYRKRRDLLANGLTEAGFDVVVPEGTYFILAHIRELTDANDQEFAETLIRDHGVAAIPPSVFYRNAPEEGEALLRFAFCKDVATLESAVERLRSLR